eukprot:jgi/Phyca11/124708/e_gw1.54.347.1
MCTHGIKKRATQKGKRQRRIIRYLGCTAQVNGVVTRNANNEWKVHATWHGSHNHLRGERLYQYYAENRRIKDPEVLRQIADMKSAGADAKGILDYLRRNTGKKTQLRDVHNTLAKLNRERRASASDEQRTEALLREFCLISGNSACMFSNDGTRVIDVVCIQSARQKRLFRAFPEVILVDTTHCTNRNLYKLFSIMVTDVFGKVLQTFDLVQL